VSDSPHNELKKPLISEEYIETSVLPSGRNETSVSCLVPLDKSKSKEIYLIEGETRVGRQRNMCDFYLNDSSVSRVHAIFEKKGDKVTVRDAGSTNGTYLNDKRLSMEEEAETNLGDTISIADIQYECF
jgi:predicted component of type VI protein secretion system